MTMDNTLETPLAGRQVYLGYAAGDRDIAQQLTASLRGAGIRVRSDEWSDAWKKGIADELARVVSWADVFVVLLSPRAEASEAVQIETGVAWTAALRNKGVAILPAMIENCEIPSFLADRAFVDLRHDTSSGIRRIVDQLAVGQNINFSKLDEQKFETLVADLLADMGFEVRHVHGTAEMGHDLVASHSVADPFGGQKNETWLVEVKLYRKERVNISSLRQMLGYLTLSDRSHKGLIVTNSGVTSVAREFVEEMSEKTGRECRIIDGAELTSLLIQHPAVAGKYFSPIVHD
jgi:hypothetical protein